MEIISLPIWVIFFLIFGILALVTALTALFFPIFSRPKKYTNSEVPAVDSEDFLQALAGVANAPVQSGGQAKLLNNGEQFFPEILEAINKAEKTINFMTYIWTKGKMSDLVFEGLINALHRKVEVRIVLDGFGGTGVDDEKLKLLEKAGGKVCWFRPAHLGKLTRFYRRNHRRAIIMDGFVGFIGGAAIEDKWLGNAENPEHWRDSMVKVTGSMAENLQSAFIQVWTDTYGEFLVGRKFYPHQGKHEGITDSTTSKHVSIISSPSSEFHPISNVFWLSIKAGREKIYLTYSYFVPDKTLRNILKEKAKEGVDVRILLPNDYIDGNTIRWASHRYFEELLQSGVKIYEYQPTMIHSKTIVVDGKFSIVGSANFDIRSTELNKENILCIVEKDFASDLENTFFQDLKHAKQMKLGAWKKRSILRRLRERFASLFEEQY
ncbi:MAG: phospholipase D-like domain-containing protein [Patescibacteria group bacterium]